MCPWGTAKRTGKMRMMIRPIAAPLALMMMLAACTTTTSSQGSVAPTAELVPPDPIADWRNVISAADKMRLEGLEAAWRSEEHTSELQSLMRISYAVFCLKKKKQQTSIETQETNAQTDAKIQI